MRPDLGGDVAPISQSNKLFKMLALSGGGYRGLFSCHVLSRYERETNRKTGEAFDLIVGTSTGALLGAAIALGIPAAKIEQTYRLEGPRIFSRRGWWHSGRRLLHSAPYDPSALYSAIRSLVGAQVASSPLRALDINFVATAVSHTREQARVFGAGRFARSEEDISLEDAIVASAAAPTFFPSKQINGENLVDGGLVANAPELIGIALAHSVVGVALSDLRVLAVGTACPSAGLPSLRRDRRGILGWLLSRRGLVRLTMSSQEHLTRNLAAQLMNEHYLLIDKSPAPDQVSALIEMDNTSEQTTSTLLLLADVAWSEFLDNPRHRFFV